MNKIGNLDIVDTRTFIVPATDSVWFSIMAMGWTVKINIVFEPTAAEQSIRMEPKPDHARIIF